MLLDRKKTMNRRFISVLLALSLSTLAACGGDDQADTGTSTLALSGVYRPVDQGSIGSITFANGKDYSLVPASCTTASCVEVGTYRLDAPAHALVLEDGTTHATRSIAIDIVKTADTSAALVSSVRPLDLVDPGEQLTRNGQETTKTGQDTTKTGQETTSGSGQLNGAASQLLQLVKELIMAGQQMKRDDKADEQKPADNKPPAEKKPADPKADPNADPNVNPQPAPKNP
jgi:hypothetical protein